MATTFLINGKNTGKDVSLTIIDSLGHTVSGAQLGILTHFEINAEYAIPKTKSIINNGQIFYESLPDGGKATIKLVRTNSALEDMEYSFRTNSLLGIQLTYTLQYQTMNRDGTVNTRQLLYCKPHNFNLGAYAAQEDVTQSVEFEFSLVSNTGTSTSLFLG